MVLLYIYKRLCYNFTPNKKDELAKKTLIKGNGTLISIFVIFYTLIPTFIIFFAPTPTLFKTFTLILSQLDI